MSKKIKKVINDIEITFELECTNKLGRGMIQYSISTDNHRIKYKVSYAEPLTHDEMMEWMDENEQKLFDYYVSFLYKRNITRFEYTDGELHPYLGKEYPLSIKIDKNPGVYSLDLINDKFEVRISETFPNHKNAIAILFKKWYENKAYIYFKERSEIYRKKMDFVPDGDLIIKIVESKKFHGRCTWGKRQIEYNYPVIKLSPAHIDYLVVHELCHFKEHNHQPPFWKLVRKYCNDYLFLDMDLNVQAIQFSRGI